MCIQVCLAKPDSDRPETTMDRTCFREPPPIDAFVRYIPDFPVIRYPIHRTIIAFNPMYRVHLDRNVVRIIISEHEGSEDHSLDLHISQQLRVYLKQGDWVQAAPNIKGSVFVRLRTRYGLPQFASQ